MATAAKSSLRIEPSSHVSTTQRTHLAPAAIQGLEVLSLPVTQLEAYAQSLADENPLLDFDSDGFSVADDALFSEITEKSDGEEFDDWASASEDVFRKPRGWEDNAGFDLNRLRDECVQTETLACHLASQLNHTRVGDIPLSILNGIIDCINDDGYFDGNLAALCLDAKVDPDMGQRALECIQGLTPRGVGARNLRECLLLQLDNDAPLADKTRQMIEEGLDDLAENRTTKLMRTYHVSLDELAAIREVIAGFDPRPGSSFSQKRNTVYVVPDLVVERRGTTFALHVAGDLTERLVRNNNYEYVIEASGDKEAQEWLAKKRLEADAALANIAQRNRTLFRFGMYLLEAQYGFFCNGEGSMRPMTMQQVADALDLHVSTVSRIVADKHILTPWGTLPLRHFFSAALPSTSYAGAAPLSSRAIKERIRQMIEGEEARRPLSDAAITEALNAQGVEIKRRTVAKYRETLGIPRQSQRRR